MPIFEFECLDCGVEFEKLVWKTASVSEVVCPVCGSGRVDEKISTFASFAKAGSSGSCAPGGG
jgi:putative FmdB family regulatory protein